jgi:hypothetical protein
LTNLFRDLSTGFARFVYAWLVPSASVVAAFVFLVLPDIRGVPALKGVAGAETPVATFGFFALAVVTLSVTFAYTSLPVYRLLEGYTLPSGLKSMLLRRRLRAWYRLKARVESLPDDHPESGVLIERLAAYPDTQDEILPTRLGNALRGMERYGVSRFGLDSQILWYELQAVTPPNLRRDAEDARASVDFFVAAILHYSLLGILAAAVAVATGGLGSAVVVAGCLLVVPASYHEAVRNVGEWRAAVQALVNLGRVVLPEALGLRQETTFEAERRMWESYAGIVVYGTEGFDLAYLNSRRAFPGLPNRR